MSEERYEYDIEIEWTGERRATLTLDGRPQITVGTPPEFGGHEDVVSPEELFCASVATCFITTFFTIAEKRKLHYRSIISRAHGVLERDEDRKRRFTSFVLTPELVIEREEDRKRAQKTLELSERLCLVTNSISSAIELKPTIRVGTVTETETETDEAEH